MEQKIFRNFLLARGCKLTKERVAVLNQITAFKGHFEPEQLYFRLREAGIKASRASVYRTLNLLVEGGLVEKITRTETGNVYEQTFGTDHHDHMICDACGNIIEFCSEKIEKLQEEICRKNSFVGRNHTLVIRGYCEACEKKEP